MALIEKFTITPEGGTGIIFPFNPKDLTISKTNKYSVRKIAKKDAGKPDFKGGGAFSISLKDLTFDTTESYPWASASAGSNVHIEYIKPLLNLMAYDETTFQPPLCEVTWGSFNFEWGEDSEQPLKNCIVKNVDVQYTLFTDDLIPIRAIVSIDIEQGEDATPPPQNPTSRTENRKTHIVMASETLDWIAYKEYGNPAYWRYLAQANNLSDPRNLRPGQILRIPKFPAL